LPRGLRSARLRLTLMYAGLFLLLSTVVIGVTYGVARSSSAIRVAPAPTSAGGQVPVLQLPLPPGVVMLGKVGLKRAGTGVPAYRDIVVAQHNADTNHLLVSSWFALAVATIGAAILGWFAAGRVLRPLREMSSTARTITAGNLDQRLALTGPNDEFRQLGDTFDDLLGRLEGAFEAQRRFVANASHELRTPLTVERTLLQVALANPDASERSLRAACEEILCTQLDHERLLESLLTLASSERGVDQRCEVDLAAVVDAALLSPPAGLASLTVSTDLRPALILGDEVLVARLVANLLDNAVEHNVPDGSITISVSPAGGQVVLCVSNSGAVIGAADAAVLFEPFQRLGRVGDGGHHGLGLSIVRAIVVAHAGVVSAEPLPAGGLSVAVFFPALGGSGIE
jgi:signal transduction histidine kinase